MRNAMLLGLAAVLSLGLPGLASTDLFASASGNGNVAIGNGLAAGTTEIYGSIGINGTVSFAQTVYYDDVAAQWIIDKDFHAEGDFWIWDWVYDETRDTSGELFVDTRHHLAGNGAVDFQVDGYLSPGRGGWNSWVGGSTSAFVVFWVDLNANGANSPVQRFVGTIWGGDSASLPWPGWFRGDMSCTVAVGESPAFSGTEGVNISNESFAIWNTVLLAPERGSW